MTKNVSSFEDFYRDELKGRPIVSQNGAMEKWLSRGQECLSRENVVIFVDPPYEKHDLYKDHTLKLLKDESVKAHIWIESDKDKGVPLEFWEEQGFTPYKVFKQGASYIALFD